MTVRIASLPPLAYDLAYSSTVAMPSGSYAIGGFLPDGKGLLVRAVNKLHVSFDYGATLSTGTTFKDGFWGVDGAVKLPDGEMLVSVRRTGYPGEVWKTTGWNDTTGASSSVTKVLTCGGDDVYIRGTWGINPACIAPPGSKHAGAIFLAEYATTRTEEAATPAQAAIRVYASFDGGSTFTTIFDVRDRWPGDTHLHVHGCTYDWLTGRLLVSQGDGRPGVNTGHCGIFYSDNPEASTPTWTAVPGSTSDDLFGQVTGMRAVEAGIVCGPDGRAQSVRLIPRRGQGYGSPVDTIAFGGDLAPYIGGTVWRNGGLDTPQPASPILVACQEAASGYSTPMIALSTDGLSWREGYRHASGAGGFNGIEKAYGPDIYGRVVCTFDNDGTPDHLVLDYLPVVTGAKVTRYPHRIFSGRFRADATAQIDTTISEAGNASLAGGSGGLAIFRLDPARHDRIVIELEVETNATAPAADIQLKLYPVTAVAGAVTNITPTIGTVTAQAILTAPAASTVHPVVQTEMACPAAGAYLLKVGSSTTLTANSSVQIRGSVYGRAA